MRVNIQSLPGAENQPLASIYLLFGDEILPLEETSVALRRKAQAQAYTERLSFVAEQGFNWDELLQSGSSMSLFGDKQLIELRMPTGKPGQAGSKVLCELLENFPPDVILLVICGSVDRAGQNQKWFKALDKAGVTAEAKEIKLNDLPAWLAARLRSKGLLADQESIALLTHYFEGNLLAAAQEIDLLALNTGASAASPSQAGAKPDAARQLEALQASVSDNSRFSVFSYLDACLSGDWQRTCRILDGLRSEKDESVFLVVMLSREVRKLVQMSVALAGGANKDQVFKQYRIWYQKQAVFDKAIKRHGQAGWQTILQQLAKIDKILKGRAQSEGASVWFDIEKLSMNICGLNVTSAK
jgi:DNA polymerase-3 subunit delta